MIHIKLLVIQLMPDFLLIAAVVVIAHWIWLFGFKKGGYQPATSLKVSGHNKDNKPLDPVMAANFISSSHRASMPAIVEKEPTEAHLEKGERASYPDAQANVPQHYSTEETFQGMPSQIQQTEPGVPTQAPFSQTDYQKQILSHYAGLNMTSWLHHLRQGEVDPENMRELDTLANLTIADHQEYGNTVDNLSFLFDHSHGELPSLAFLN